MKLTVISQNSMKITLGWTPPAGVTAYRFLRDGQALSSSFDPSKSQVTFGIPDDKPHTFEVDALGKLDSGQVTVNQASPPPPPPPPAAGGWPLPQVRTPTIYVAPGASDTGAGTLSAPMSLKAAVARAGAGDVVSLDTTKGPYAIAGSFYPAHSGSAAEPVQWAARGGRAVLQGKGSSSHYVGFDLNAGTCWHDFFGIDFDGSLDTAHNMVAGVRTKKTCHHIGLYGCRGYQLGAAGTLVAMQSDYLTVAGNDVWRCGDGSGWSSGIDLNNQSAAWSYDGAPGFHNVFVGNRVAGMIDGSTYDTDGNGFIFDLCAAWTPCLVAGNLLYMNGGRGYEVNSPASMKVWVVNNTCWKNGLDLRKKVGWGEFVALGASNQQWANNLAVSSSNSRRYWLMNGATVSNITNAGFGPNGDSGFSPQFTSDPKLQAFPVFSEGQAEQWKQAPAPWRLAAQAFRPAADSPIVGKGYDPRTLPGLDPTMVKQIEAWLSLDLAGAQRNLTAPTLGALA